MNQLHKTRAEGISLKTSNLYILHIILISGYKMLYREITQKLTRISD